MVSGVTFVLARFSSAHISQSFCQIFLSFPALEDNFSYNNANRMHVQDQHNLLSDALLAFCQTSFNSSELGMAQIMVLRADWMCSVAIDSCQAMEAYDQNPHNSSIARLLPCLTPLAGAEALSGAKKAIKTVIKRSNNAVDLLNHQEERMAASGDIDHPTFLPHVCDPFGPEPELLPRECSSAEGSFANFEDVSHPLFHTTYSHVFQDLSCISNTKNDNNCHYDYVFSFM